MVPSTLMLSIGQTKPGTELIKVHEGLWDIPQDPVPIASFSQLVEFRVAARAGLCLRFAASR